MSDDVDCVFIFSPVDFDMVQQHTEMYYLSEYCSERFETHVATPSSQLSGVVNHHFNFDGILGIILLNILYVPVWTWLFVVKRPDVIYCYPEVVTPPLIGRIVTDTRIVFDIRAEPFEQREEFVSEKGQSLSVVKRYLYIVDKILFQFVIRRSDLVVTLSEDLAEKISHNYQINPDSIHILPLGVNPEKFQPNDDGHDAELSMVYIGSINSIRGFDTFVDAVSRLDQATQSKLRFDLIGGGDDQYINHLVSRIDDELPTLSFEYHGYVEHEAVPSLAAKSDVAISLLPRLESFSVSSPAKIYEYLALGLPIIATDIPAHHRILTHGEDAIIVDPDDVDTVAAAIQSLLSEPDRINRLSEGARNTALQHSWESRFSTLFERIRSL